MGAERQQRGSWKFKGGDEGVAIRTGLAVGPAPGSSMMKPTWARQGGLQVQGHLEEGRGVAAQVAPNACGSVRMCNGEGVKWRLERA